ncbi:MAG: tRNA dihydrouridine synthase [Lachnospiraceae bacterium]
MKFYMAPLEGITTHIFRNAYDSCFIAMDKYFTPFLVPHSKKGFSTREKKEILPENNKGLYLVPQIMSNHADECLKTIEKLQVYGYQEINLNMGCPSKTVVSKGRGSGFLAYPEELDRFLYEVFEGTANKNMKISVKTRIGKEMPEEFFRLLDIYNRYPLEELIIHPRVQKDFYNNIPNLEMFEYGLKTSKNPVCYNGDIFCLEDFNKIKRRFPSVQTVMLGRGIVGNPMLLEEILNFGEDKKRKIKQFHDQLYHDYMELGIGEKNVLFKMKEVWCYLGNSFPGNEKVLKKIKKAERLDRYCAAVSELL